jgi:NADPH2 dehydrogenase
MSALFSPIRLGRMTLPNRIVVSPMCQYSAIHGDATDWHLAHLGQLAMSGAALVLTEAAAVEPIGRISHGDLGLYDDENEAALKRVLGFCRKHGTSKLGIQLAHAGRKASAKVPWEGGGPVSPDEDPWETVAPSAIPFADGWPAPREASETDMDRIVLAHAAAAERAVRLGFDAIEMHASHGYLLHEFLSPISNRRTDAFGGPLENRMRFPLRVFEAIRAAAGEDVAVGARITGSDWMEGGITPDEAVHVARELERRGCDYLDVTSGGVSPNAKVELGPGYQVPFADAVKRAVRIPVWSVGLIVTPHQAEEIVASGRADMVALARTILDDPRWPWHAADALGAEIARPPQYERAGPKLWPGAKYKNELAVARAAAE